MRKLLPELVVSDWVRMECRCEPIASGDGARLQRFDEFFKNLDKVHLTATVFDEATNIRGLHGIKASDALHLAAAIESGCDEFWTNDLRLSKVTSRIKIRVPF